MSERRPDDVLARCVGVVNASMITEGDAAWHWRVVTDELDRARRVELEQRLELTRYAHEREEMSEQLRQRDAAIRMLQEERDQERNIVDMLYHGIKEGHPIGGKRMSDALKTVEAWMEHGRKP